jgi:hypothetical protein
MIAMMTAVTPSEKASSRAFENRPSAFAMAASSSASAFR